MTLPESEECTSNSPPPKKIKLEEASRADSPCEIGLLSCCDDLLLEIFSYLKPTDLLALSQCCQRLQQVVFDRTLWISVDFRPTPLTHLELDKYVQFLLPTTISIVTIGPWKSTRPAVRPVRANEEDNRLCVNSESTDHNVGDQASSSTTEAPSFTSELLKKIKEAAPNITTLILEKHILDVQDICWEHFPNTIENLSFSGCHMLRYQSSKSFFFGLDKCMPRLKTFDLSGCRWFEPHSLLALSKCPVLEVLRIADCLIQDFVPYISLGTRFGFKALTVVDFRRTWVSDREVSCLNKTPSLKELYLEAPVTESTMGRSMITDMAVTAFGTKTQEWNAMGYYIVLMAHYDVSPTSSLEVIELRNYISVTDTSLRHCASCLKGLKLLNIKGTSCTETGVIAFISQRPDVQIISDFTVETSTNEGNTEGVDQ